MRQLTNEQLLELVDSIVGDEFCEDLNCTVILGYEKTYERTRAMLEEAARKLCDIYTVVHSHRTEHSCYHAHEPWREEGVVMYEKMKANEAARKEAAEKWKAEYDAKKAAETEQTNVE